MLNTITEKVLSGLLCALLVAGAGLAIYAEYEHSAAQAAQISKLQSDNAQEQANTTAALQAAKSLGAALDAKATAQQTAAANHTAATAQLATAVAANPSAASAVVPEAVWDAIYGSPTNAK